MGKISLNFYVDEMIIGKIVGEGVNTGGCSAGNIIRGGSLCSVRCYSRYIDEKRCCRVRKRKRTARGCNVAE